MKRDCRKFLPEKNFYPFNIIASEKKRSEKKGCEA